MCIRSWQMSRMSGLTAAEIFKQLPKGLVDFQVSDIHIEQLISKIVHWEDFAAFLKLSEAEQEEIRRNNERNYKAQKRQALRLWREKNGRDATYRKLIVIFCSLQKNSLADSVRQLLLEQDKESSVSILDTYRKYLVDCYTEIPHPSRTRWPFLHTSTYVDLPLFEVPLTEQSSLARKQEGQPRKLVELSKVLPSGNRKAKRNVVLLEGVAGCGKTTLLWHACQDWAQGRLFQQFSLLIHVSLEDPDIRSATCLADIIPHPSPEMREGVAKAIAEKHGKRVCFLLDGWDEAPPAVQQRGSFFHGLIGGGSARTMLPHCSVIVSSRPAASGLLSPLVTTKVEIGRLDNPGIDDIIDASLPPDESEQLQKIIRQRQQLASLCNLPINAAIMVFLFHVGVRHFPETSTGLFQALLCNLLIRHMQLRTSHGILEVKNLEDLPQDVREKFIALSSLAFTGIVNQNRVFDTSILRKAGLTLPFDSLSLMESRQQLTWFGPSNSYSFLHHSVQEFLAAWHMTRLGSEEQAKAVSGVLHTNPLSLVVPFFAGLTRLSSPKVRNILLKVTEHCLDASTVLANNPHTESADRRRLALALLNSLYESQNRTLCQRVKPPLPPGRENDFPPGMCIISFPQLGLQPFDCLSVGYFMANHSCCCIDLTQCYIGGSGVEALMNNLKEPADAAAVSIAFERMFALRWIILSWSVMSPYSVRLISTSLATTPLTSICFSNCWHPVHAAVNLTAIIEGLCRRKSFFDLDLSMTLTSEHTLYIVLLLTTCPIKLFQLTGTDISGGITLIAEALKYTKLMIQLWLSKCNIGDRGLIALGKALQGHKSITLLVVDGNPFSFSAVRSFLQCQYSSRLMTLDIGRPLNREEEKLRIKVNKFRVHNYMPELSVVNRMAPWSAEPFRRAMTLLSLPQHIRTRNQ